jgi:hypothetical protein
MKAISFLKQLKRAKKYILKYMESQSKPFILLKKWGVAAKRVLHKMATNIKAKGRFSNKR